MDYTKNRLPKADYENCIFENCKFSDSYLDNQNFMECEFIECDLGNANVKNTIFKEVVFKRCKLIGLHIEDCNDFLMSFQFENCNLNLASFLGMKLANTRFTECKLVQTDFAQADLTKALFLNCNMENAIFQHTVLEKADLSTSFNFNIDPEQNRLKKAKFSKDNLRGLLKKYDIVIE
ncbi:pentapeptide repeat-containing protein [Flagellimonas aquimarina]|nr:pentapeptide repeat-containing protein [Allomuricauda koreensis]